MKNLILTFLLFSSMATAKLDYHNEIQLMMSARHLDQYEYCQTAGVCVQEEVLLDPHFTGLRVESCNKRIWYFESTAVVLPCFASFADRLSWRLYSRMRQTYEGIKLYNAGKKKEGAHMIYANLAERISLRESD